MKLQRLLLPLALQSVGRLARSLLRDAMPIFMFHRFAQPERGIAGHAPSDLRRGLASLRREGIRVVTLADLTGPEAGRTQGKGVQVAITIDDGYSDFIDVALPIFAEFDCPVTVFVSTGVIDRECWYWWDTLQYIFATSTRTTIDMPFECGRLVCNVESKSERDRVVAALIERLKTVADDVRRDLLARLAAVLEVDASAAPPSCAAMTWQDIRACAATGLITFGPHTITHPALPMTSAAQAKREIVGSWTRLQQMCTATLPIFCYPFGAYSAREIEIVRGSGLLGALTTEPRYAPHAPFALTHELERFTVPRFGYPDDPMQFLQIALGVERVKMALRHGRDGWRTHPRQASAIASS